MSNSSKEICKWLPKLIDRRWSSDVVEHFFLKNTCSGFESRGSTWAFAPDLTPYMGPKRIVGVVRKLGHATHDFSSPL
jgi:hypothetical protein